MLISGIVACGLLGGATNAINGWLGPTYFINIFGWDWMDPEEVWRASIAQGIFEGLLTGVLFSLLFAVGLGIITQGRAGFLFAVRYLALAVAVAVLFWGLGGLAAMGLAALSPTFYRQAIVGVPDEFAAMMAYAWVGGSILGLQLVGGVASIFVSLVLLRADWLRRFPKG